MAARCMKFNVDRADIGFAGLRAAIPGESQDRSIDRDFEGETPLKARDSSVARRSSASSFFGIVGLVRPRHDVAGATSTTGGSLFSLPASAIRRFFLLFFYLLSLSPSCRIHPPVFSLEQLTTGQPWPTDCTPSLHP